MATRVPIQSVQKPDDAFGFGELKICKITQHAKSYSLPNNVVRVSLASINVLSPKSTAFLALALAESTSAISSSALCVEKIS